VVDAVVEVEEEVAEAAAEPEAVAEPEAAEEPVAAAEEAAPMAEEPTPPTPAAPVAPEEAAAPVEAAPPAAVPAAAVVAPVAAAAAKKPWEKKEVDAEDGGENKVLVAPLPLDLTDVTLAKLVAAAAPDATTLKVPFPWSLNP
jgi:hypothetical protein